VDHHAKESLTDMKAQVVTRAFGARPVATFVAPPPAAFPADRLVLFESRPQGGYTPLQTWTLRRV
jgi:hypothetical protein